LVEGKENSWRVIPTLNLGIEVANGGILCWDHDDLMGCWSDCTGVEALETYPECTLPSVGFQLSDVNLMT
jgi:hypothetical protein